MLKNVDNLLEDISEPLFVKGADRWYATAVDRTDAKKERVNVKPHTRDEASMGIVLLFFS